MRRLVDAARVEPYEQARARLRSFVEERDWDQFHAPKDLAMSVAIEAGELLELFQWRDPAQAIGEEERRRIAEELADVAMYLVLLADKTGVDLWPAVEAKLAENARRYPVERAKGRADKYDRL